MKFLKLLILLLISAQSFAQYYSDIKTPIHWTKGGFDSLFIPTHDTIIPADKTRGWLVLKGTTLYTWQQTKWVPVSGGSSVGGSLDSLPFGGAITSVPTIGFNPNTTNVAQWITNSFYGSQSPTASISGGSIMELMSAGAALTIPVTWTATRLGATAEIASITVNGQVQPFSQPAAGSNVSGTISATVQRNVNTDIPINVTTTDGKTATASTSVIFSPKRYFGWVNSSNPSDGDILSTASEFSTAIAKDWIQTAPAGSQNLMYAHPSNEGDVTDITINGFPSIQAFEISKRLFTNASGYTQLYTIITSTNKFSVTGTTAVSVK